MKRMMKFLWLVMVSWMVATAHADELFDKANAHYAAGEFKQAAEAYESVLAKEGPQVGALQNLGSAYYRLGDDGLAILAFERALLLKPRDPDLLANLKLAQDEAAVFPVVRDTGGVAVLDYFSAKEWSRFALGAAVLLPFLALGWVLLAKKYRWVSMVLAGFSVCVFGVSMYALSLRGDEKDRGIVTGGGTEVKISPFEKSETRGTLAVGREVKLGKEESGYYWVSADAGALAGWVKKESLARITAEK